MKKAIRDMEPGVDVFISNDRLWTRLKRSQRYPKWFHCKPRKGRIAVIHHGDKECEIIGRIGPDGRMEEVE
jgi:hypothetical protein